MTPVDPASWRPMPGLRSWAIASGSTTSQTAKSCWAFLPACIAKDYNRKIVNAIRTSDIRVNGEPCRIERKHQDHPPGRGHILLPRQEPPGRLPEKRRGDRHRSPHLGHGLLRRREICGERHGDPRDRRIDRARQHHECLLPGAQALHRLQGSPRHPPGQQIAYLGDPCEMDVQEEIDAYMKRIRSVMDHYLEKLPAHPDMGIIGGGGAMIQNFAGGHGLLVVTSRHGERNRLLPLRQHPKIGRRLWQKTSSSTGCTYTR